VTQQQKSADNNSAETEKMEPGLQIINQPLFLKPKNWNEISDVFKKRVLKANSPKNAVV